MKAKAAVFTGALKPFDVREFNITKTPSGYGKSELIASGVCGTDLHFHRGKLFIQPPTVIGHEFVGKLVECDEKEDIKVITEKIYKSTGRKIVLIIDDYDLFLKKIKNRIIKCDYSNEDNIMFKALAEKVEVLLNEAKINEYVNEMINFTDFLFVNDFSKDDLLIYLKLIHPLFPFLSEELYDEIFGGRFSIVSEGYPI